MTMPALCRALLLALVLAGTAARADWQPEPGDKLQQKSAAAIEDIRERLPDAARYFAEAHAMAIIPSATRVALGFGGAYGKGIVIEGSELIGTTRYWQFTGGIQGGARNFSMIIFFKDKEALEYYKTGELQFVGQAGLAAGTAGVASTPAYNEGVAILTVTRLGLMFEFSYSGAKFTYKPLAEN